jgi:phage terminase large subunit-like protein
VPLDFAWLAKASQEQITAWVLANPDVLDQIADAVVNDRKQSQLAYYQLANPMAARVHSTIAREVAIVGGNRSSKTDSMMAELAIRMTGHVPLSLQATYPREKLATLPIRARVVCNSLTDTLEPVIKPKLRWDQWNGVGDPSEGRGHWGWIPQHCLKGGTWEKAYSEKYRTLYANVDSYWVGSNGTINSMRGTSTCQFLSYDQDITAFSGSSMHWVGHDELPKADIYRENRLRTLDVRGQIMTAFTPPDEIGQSRADVSWFYDDVYEPGRAGKDGFETIVLHTEANRILDAAAIADLASKLTDEQREVRLHGNFLHLSGVIYSLFTQGSSIWCFACQKKIVPVDGRCLTCKGDNIESFTHVVEPHPVPSQWPIVMVIDPHPRKKDAIGWFAITPSDDVVLVAEAEADGTAGDVKRVIDEVEQRNRLLVRRRLMDPNIATETNDKMGRNWTIRKAYDDVGIRCDLANDDINVGINEVKELLKPDPRTRRPRFRCFSTCTLFRYGMSHWSWDEHVRVGDKEPKEKVRDKAKDYPDLIRYLALDKPEFAKYARGAQIIRGPVRQRDYASV